MTFRIRNNNGASTNPLDHRAIYYVLPFSRDQSHSPNKGTWGFFFYKGPRKSYPPYRCPHCQGDTGRDKKLFRGIEERVVLPR